MACAEHRQTFAQRHDLLFVQPEERTFHQLGHVPDARGPDDGVAGQGRKQVANGGVDLNVLSCCSWRNLGDQEFEEPFRSHPAEFSRLV